MSEVREPIRVVAFTGARGSGKSYFSEPLRRWAGVPAGAGDREFSDLVRAGLNAGLATIGDPLDTDSSNARWLIPVVTALQLRATPLAPSPPDHDHRPEADKCAECGFADWIEMIASLPQMPAVTRDNKLGHLGGLSWLATTMWRLHGSRIWSDEIARLVTRDLASGVPLVTVGGVRHPDDAVRLRLAGAVIIEVRRQVPNDLDPAAANRNLIVPDAVVYNTIDGMDAVETLAAELYDDLVRGHLAPSYGPTG